MIDCLGLTINMDIKANPLKIVAGLDPEGTNEFLTQLGRAAQSQVSE